MIDPNKNPWHPKCRLSFALRNTGRTGRPSLTLKPRRSQTARDALLEVFFGPNVRVLEEYDLFWVWRCTCRNNWQVIYHTIDEVTLTRGYHDACPGCGAAPIEVQ